MAIEAHPRVRHAPALPRPALRLIESRRRRAQVHLFSYVVGSALAPFAGWTLVLILHRWHVYGSVHS